MGNLFDSAPTADAVISPCGTYRYRLSRTWDDRPPVVFVMLNPSTATATDDDPTIRRCIDFAKRWDAGGLVVVNLFAFRATDPKVMRAAADPVGPENDNHIRAAVAGCREVVCAWGKDGGFRGRDRAVLRLLTECGARPRCLKLTKGGQPWHPLYIAAETPLLDLT